MWFLFIAYLSFSISNSHQVFFSCVFSSYFPIMVLALSSIQIYIILLAETCHNGVNQFRCGGTETKLCDAVSCYYCCWPWIIPGKFTDHLKHPAPFEMSLLTVQWPAGLWHHIFQYCPGVYFPLLHQVTLTNIKNKC